MDPMDFAIYRSLSPGGEARFWAGRRIIDPTIPARQIAEEVGISENGVRARLRGLAARGFLRGKTAIPNPSLFDVQVYSAALAVPDAGDVEKIYRDLSLVDGVVFARDTMDEGHRELRVHFVSESPPTTVRRTALLRRLSPSGGSVDPEPYWIPPCERAPTALDWRILQAVRHHPDASVAETARTVHISLKTAARRLRQLVDARACWWTPGPDSEEFPLAFVRVEVREPARRDFVAGKIAEAAPAWMPVAADGFGLDPSRTSNVIAGLVPADAPTLVERTVQKLVAVPGVVNVRRTFALGSRTFPGWFDEQLSKRVAQGG